MTTEDDNSLVAETDEPLAVRRNRMERFLELGFPLRVSTILSKRVDVSPWDAKHLLDKGATVEEAEKILL